MLCFVVVCSVVCVCVFGVVADVCCVLFVVCCVFAAPLLLPLSLSLLWLLLFACLIA